MHPVIIINGDILTKISFQDLLKHHQKLKAAATVAVREEEYEIPFGVIDYQNKTIKKLSKSQKFFSCKFGNLCYKPTVPKICAKE